MASISGGALDRRRGAEVPAEKSHRINSSATAWGHRLERRGLLSRFMCTLNNLCRIHARVEGHSVSLVVREILAKQYPADQERSWAKEGEERLKTFDRTAAVSHETLGRRI